MKPFQIREDKTAASCRWLRSGFPRLQILYSLQSIFPIIDRFNTSFYIRMKPPSLVGVHPWKYAETASIPAPSQAGAPPGSQPAEIQSTSRSRRDSSRICIRNKTPYNIQIDFLVYPSSASLFLSFGLLQYLIPGLGVNLK